MVPFIGLCYGLCFAVRTKRKYGLDISEGLQSYPLPSRELIFSLPDD